MRDVITLGPAPSGEEWARIDQPDYINRARAHCSAYLRQLRRQFGCEPEGAELDIASLPTSSGNCLMVVCYFETENEGALLYALGCDKDALTTWDAEARRDLAGSLTLNIETVADIVRTIADAAHR
jgi:hypothetical protein